MSYVRDGCQDGGVHQGGANAEKRLSSRECRERVHRDHEGDSRGVKSHAAGNEPLATIRSESAPVASCERPHTPG